MSSTASSMFFLQNDAASVHWPVLQEHIDAVTVAFSPRKPSGEGRIGASAGPPPATDVMLRGEFSSATFIHDDVVLSVGTWACHPAATAVCTTLCCESMKDVTSGRA